jgi:cysteine desulfurase family protein
MIYLDNAATTKQKPEEVYRAYEYYAREIGVSPGRGTYRLGVEASRMLFKTRKNVAKFFGSENPNVIFTKNSTEAINLFFNGFLQKGDHVVITCYEHNAVLRPLHKLKEEGMIDYTIISRDDLEISPEELYKKYIRENTKLFVSTLASNLTGRIVYRAEVMKYMKSRGVTTFLDSSQGAGKIRIAMEEDGVDVLAFTGHKDLLAMPGVGGLVCLSVPMWKPLLQGGTGVLGDNYTNPEVFPDAYEAGTLNMPAIWSLNASLQWIQDEFLENSQREKKLLGYMMEKLEQLPEIVIYDKDYERVSTLAINKIGVKSNDLVQILDENGICTRGGIHCAILAHESLNTHNIGAVRISLGWKSTIEEIDRLIEVLHKVGD